MLTPGLLLGLWTGALAALGWNSLSDAQRAAVGPQREFVVTLAVMGWLVVSVMLGRLAHRLFEDHVQALARLHEHVRIRTSGPSREPLPHQGSAGVRALALAIASCTETTHSG